MSVLNQESFREGIPSELSLFDLPPTQVGVTNAYYDEIRPLSTVTEDSPIEFRISGQNSMDYLDLKDSQLYVKLKILKADGKALTSQEKVGPVNMFLQALFSSTEVTLQNKATITCNNNPYRAIIDALTNYSNEAKSSQLTTQLFLRDTPAHAAITDPSASSNKGLYDRTVLITLSKTVDLQGPIYHDLFNLPRYLLNQVDVKLRLNRTSPAFCLSSGDASPAYKIDILDIYMLVKKLRVNPAVIFGHNEMLKNTNAKYPFTKTETRSQSIATGSTSFHWENMFQNRAPNKVIIGFVKSKAVSGDYKSNPFYFENCNIQHIGLYADGLPVNGYPFKPTFDKTNGNAFLQAYTSLLTTAGKWRQDEGNGLSRDEFYSGSTLFAFQLEPNFSQHGEYLSLVKTGNVRLDVQFRTTLSGKYNINGVFF